MIGIIFSSIRKEIRAKGIIPKISAANATRIKIAGTFFLKHDDRKVANPPRIKIKIIP